MGPLTMAAGAYLLGTSLYNVYQNWQTRDREDNAVQRRVADLQKAGLSPTLAAGSSAQATATPGVNPGNFGAWIDAQNAVEQLKQNREYTEQAKMQTKALSYSVQEANRQNVLNQLSFDWGLGVPYSSVSRTKGEFRNTYDEKDMIANYWDPEGKKFTFSLDNSPYIQQLRNGLAMQNYSREMAEKENSWYNFNQGLNAVTDVVGLGLNAFNTFGSFGLKRRALNNSFEAFQQEINRKQNYDSWRMNGNHGSYTTYGRGYRNTRYW